MFEATFRTLPNANWLTITLILFFCGFVAFKFIYKERLVQNYFLLFSNNYFFNYGKESKSIFNLYFLISYLFQCLFITLLGFTFLKYYPINPFPVDYHVFLYIASGVSIYFLFKTLVGILLKFIFDLNETYDNVSFQKVSYLTSISLLLFPLLIISVYTTFYSEIIFKITAVLFFILLLYRYLMLVLNNKILIASHLFYFILYLCTVEIAPFIIFYKLKF
ncbi:DUF4271 domain-containing protein [Aureivirga marina]|uniref:DUF4271 domain-containing protein n=1 Tax=Aureivirga marina TaxID=1182451 RepID=UPI0018CA099B